MASLFEQYEQATQATSTKLNALSSCMVNVDGQQPSEPMFTKRRVDFSPTAPVTQMVVSNGQLVIAMANKTILRLDLAQPNEQEEIDLSKYVDSKSHLGSLFLDFTGNHLLIGISKSEDSVNHDVLYLNRQSKKPKAASKLKGYNINAVAWDARKASDASSGPALIGTTKGLLFEAVFNAVEDKYHSVSSVEQYWKQLFDFSVDGATSITGVEYHMILETDNVAFVIVTTPTRLYQFVGQIPSSMDPPVLQRIFKNDFELAPRFQELPSTIAHSRLQFFYPSAWSLPKTFAWMTGVGVLHGALDYTGQAGSETVCTDIKLLMFPKEEVDCSGNLMPMILTDFHILRCYTDKVKAICVLNEEVAVEDIYTEAYGNLVCLVKDPIKGTLWACSEYAIYKYSIHHENRNVWQIYLSRKEYALAKQYCDNNPELLDVVLSKEAQDYFEQQKYSESAVLFAKTSVSFEEVALKFMQLEDKSALEMFLQKKLMQLKLQDKIQTTMIVTWLVELYLNELGKLREQRSQSNEARSSIRSEFRAFLQMPKVKDCIADNRQVIYDLATSHGDVDVLACIADFIEDYGRVINVRIQNGAYRDALEVLQKQNNLNLYYEFCPTLMQHLPKETVDACISLGHRLDPSRLISVMVHYNSQFANRSMPLTNEATRYFEFCVRNLDCKDRRIHNYLLTLYAKFSPDLLLPYLVSQGQDCATICYDLEYALRVCSECGHLPACVHIYCTMGLYEEAVDLALHFDVDLAKRCANKPEENDDIQKKLWLKIAHHVVKEDCDIQKAMEFLQECDLIKIENILPFFPNFETIDHFKDAISRSLQDYNQHIEGLKEDMEEATQSTRQIRDEIRQFRDKCILVRPEDKCASCSYPVLTRSFYLFPCRHNFHAECLVFEVLLNVGISRRNRIEEIQKLLANCVITTTTTRGDAASSANATTGSPLPTSRESLKMELDDIIAVDCPYCGEFMIKNVDQPFIDEAEQNEVAKSWE